jgi:hypothetical protein
MNDNNMGKSKADKEPSASAKLAEKFIAASQADRIADPKLKSAAKVVALGYAHIDAAYTSGSAQNLDAKKVLMSVMAANIARGRLYDDPVITRIGPVRVNETRKAAEKSADMGKSR